MDAARAAPEAERPAANFAKGLPSTDMEKELKKRKARAKKFRITEGSQTANAGDTKKVDEALSQKKSRKRGRDDHEQGGQGAKRPNFGSSSSRSENRWSEQDRAAMETRKKRIRHLIQMLHF